MDPRYQWPPQGYYNGQYAPPPQPNGYPPNGYPVQYPPPQPMPPQFSHPQPMYNGPRVVIPPRSSQQLPQQYAPIQNDMGAPPRPAQPQAVMAARNIAASPLAQMQNPKIRQVHVPVQRALQPQVHRTMDGTSDGTVSHPRPRPPQQAQTPEAKGLQRSQSYQENVPRPQQRTPGPPNANVNQHRAPLQPQTTPQQRTSSLQSTPGQNRSPQIPRTPSSQIVHPKVVIKKSSHSVSAQPSPQQAPSKALPEDLSVLLLHAADEYINAARGMGPMAAISQREAHLDQYYKLMATGLGCMEAVLKKYNQSPRDEAMLRLRYASLLVEETDNNVEIEEVLSKGIALCQRSRLLDLKYSMQHLQARYQFKTNHRAALKSLDQPIAESETFQHIVWVYAFRFLKVSLALQVPGRPETASALQQLHAIANHAEKRGDRAIYVTASALEAMVLLRTPGLDHLEHAQRALAAARTYQLQVSTKELGQIANLIETVDLACSLQQGTACVPKQGKPDYPKMQRLHERADQETETDSGNFAVLIEKSFGGNLTVSTGGIFNKAADGRDELILSWLPGLHFKLLSYYLSGIATAPQDVMEGLRYLPEGLRSAQDLLQRPITFDTSIPTAIRYRNWGLTLEWHMRFVFGLAKCRAEDVPAAKRALMTLRQQVAQPPFANAERYTQLITYLSGVIDQTEGSLDSALATYSSPEFSLPDAGSHPDFKTEVAIFATMNRILILRNPSHPEHYLMSVLFSQLEPLCASHPNATIEVALRIIRFLTADEQPINRQKTLANIALPASNKVQNHQFLALCLSFVAERFFQDTVGGQAIQSAQAARKWSNSSKSSVWRAVALGVCVNILNANGMVEQANECLRQVEKLAERLPKPLRERMRNGGGHVEGNDVQMG